MKRRSESRPRLASVARSGFTLIELLVVILIILLVSAVALPVVLPALSHREVSEAARILQAAIVGARDAAVHANAPRGIRLLPDPNFISFNASGQVDGTKILASNRLVAIEPAPDYTEGRVNVQASITFQYMPLSLPYPGEGGGSWPYQPSQTPPPDPPLLPMVPVLVLEEALTTNDNYVVSPSGQRCAPTSWFWNVRLGDKIQIGNSGTLYTVVGPMNVGPAGGNAELFANVGPPGVLSTLSYPSQPNNGMPTHEFLFLVNDNDDDGDGFIDEGWDGVDNNLDQNGLPGPNGPTGLVDEVFEWESERWMGDLSGASAGASYWNLPYKIFRRPTPSANARESTLPASVVVDLTTWGFDSPERSRLPVNPFTGTVDVMVTPQGEVLPNTIFSSPTSFKLADTYFHFWLAERTDLYSPGNPFDPNAPPGDFKIQIGAGPPTINNDGLGYGTPQYPPHLPTPLGFNSLANVQLKGESRLLTLFTRTGEIAVNEITDFDPNSTNYNTGTPTASNYNPSRLLIRAQQGVRGGQ